MVPRQPEQVARRQCRQIRRRFIRVAVLRPRQCRLDQVDCPCFTLPTRVDGGNHFDTADYFPFFQARVEDVRFPVP